MPRRRSYRPALIHEGDVAKMPSPPISTRQSREFPSPPLTQRPHTASSSRTSRCRKLSEDEKKHFTEILCTPRSSRNRGPRRVYDFLEQKLVLKYVPNMSLTTSSEDDNVSDTSSTEEMHDDSAKIQIARYKRMDSPRPRLSHKLLPKFHNVDKYYV